MNIVRVIKKILPQGIYLFLKKMKYLFLRCFMRLFWIIPIDEKKIVFDNFNGNGYGDNPKYIAEGLRNRGNYKLLLKVPGSVPHARAVLLLEELLLLC